MLILTNQFSEHTNDMITAIYIAGTHHTVGSSQEPPPTPWLHSQDLSCHTLVSYALPGPTPRTLLPGPTPRTLLPTASEGGCCVLTAASKLFN